MVNTELAKKIFKYFICSKNIRYSSAIFFFFQFEIEECDG